MLAIRLFTAFALLVPLLGQAQVMSARAAARFLDQATWGATPAAVSQLQAMGTSNWLAEQFALNTSDLPDQSILNSIGVINRNLAPVQAKFMENAVKGQDQLRQRVALALTEIWVVSPQPNGVPAAYAYPPYWRIFRDGAFGNYRDLIQNVTLSPAMGNYLNLANNNRGDTKKGTVPNENYARELMQLFTIGLMQLNLDGTPVIQNGATVPTFSPAIVTDTARVLTGWTYPTAPHQVQLPNNPPYYFGQMIPVDSEHDTGAKTVVGNVLVSAGQSTSQDLQSLLDALMAQPTMAPFVCQQLIQHLVTSSPSPAYIQRVSSVFENDGTGVVGNLKAVITAILTDPDARAADDPAFPIPASYGHLREPILMMANVLRGLNGTLTDANKTGVLDAQLGENLFNAPSVFSYFSPQYTTEFNLSGPEFQIYTNQTALGRVKLISTILYPANPTGFTVDLSQFISRANNTSDLLNYVSTIFLHGQMSQDLTQATTTAVNSVGTLANKAKVALYVVLTSSEYQILQ